jgi:hypothetical protein
MCCILFLQLIAACAGIAAVVSAGAAARLLAACGTARLQHSRRHWHTNLHLLLLMQLMWVLFLL